MIVFLVLTLLYLCDFYLLASLLHFTSLQLLVCQVLYFIIVLNLCVFCLNQGITVSGLFQLEIVKFRGFRQLLEREALQPFTYPVVRGDVQGDHGRLCSSSGTLTDRKPASGS